MGNASRRLPTFAAAFRRVRSVGGRWFPRRRLRRIGIAVAGLAAFYTLFGFVALPMILKSVIASQGTKALGRRVSVERVRVNPYALSVRINGLDVREPDGKEKFASVGEIYVNAEASSITRLAPILSEIRVESPYVHVVRLDEKRFNFSDLIKPSAPKPAPEKPTLFSLNNIRVLNGEVRYSDRPKGKEHALSAIQLSVPSVSNFPYYIETAVQPSFSAAFDGSPITLTGATRPFAESRETTMSLELKDLDIPRYLAYAPFDMGYRVLSGALNLKATVSYMEFKKAAPEVTLWSDVSVSRVEVEDLAGRPMVKLPRLAVEGVIFRLPAMRAYCRKVSIVGLDVNAARDAAGRINLLSLVPRLAPAPPAPAAPKAPGQAVALEVGEIALIDAGVAFADAVPRTPFSAKVAPINVRVTDFSTHPGRPAAYAVSFAAESGEMFSTKGQFCLDPMSVRGTMNLDGVALKTYAPYYQDAIRFDLAGGTLGVGAAYEAAVGATLDARVADVAVTLAGLKLQRRDNRAVFLDIPLTTVSGTRGDLAKREVYVGAVRTERGLFAAKRLTGGRIDLMDLLPPAAPAGAATPGAAPTAPPPPDKPWHVTLKELDVRQYSLDLVDEVPAPPAAVSLRNLRVRVEDFSLPPVAATPARFAAGFDVNADGSLAVEGDFGIQPPAVTAQLTIKDLGLKLGQPYLADFAKALIASGSFSAEMKIAAKQDANGPFAAQVEGDVSVDKLAMVDPSAGELVKWDKLALTGIRAATPPLQVSIDEIALTGPGARVIMTADGTMNLTDALVTPPARGEGAPAAAPAPAPAAEPAPAPAAEPAASAPPPIRIGRLVGKGGKVLFTDRTISPNYSLNVTDLSWKVEGFSLKGDTVATIDAGARLDQAPLRVTGRLRPVPNNLFADLRVVLSDLNLTAFTPYSDKYVGYPVTEGKLSLDLQYLIDQRKLDSKNGLRTDQFTLGERVDSPTATKLPVKFALALITDRHGRIKLDIPVKGSLDDPKFRVLPIVLHVLTNLVEKAATSPFSLLASLVGGGRELSFVEFDFGGAELNDGAKQALDKLVAALADRPALRFEIRPQIDAVHDTDAIRKRLFDLKLKAQKLKELVKKGQAVGAVEDVTIAPEEYDRLLTLAYEEEDMPKPRTIIGTLKTQPRAEMERMLNEHIQVTPDDLRELAYRRAAAVRDYMLAANTVEAGRLFLIEPQALPADQAAEAKGARVVFNLQAGESGPSGPAFAAPAATREPPAAPHKRSRLSYLLYGAGGVIVLVGVGLLAL